MQALLEVAIKFRYILDFLPDYQRCNHILNRGNGRAPAHICETINQPMIPSVVSIRTIALSSLVYLVGISPVLALASSNGT